MSLRLSVATYKVLSRYATFPSMANTYKIHGVVKIIFVVVALNILTTQTRGLGLLRWQGSFSPAHGPTRTLIPPSKARPSFLTKAQSLSISKYGAIDRMLLISWTRLSQVSGKRCKWPISSRAASPSFASVSALQLSSNAVVYRVTRLRLRTTSSVTCSGRDAYIFSSTCHHHLIRHDDSPWRGVMAAATVMIKQEVDPALISV